MSKSKKNTLLVPMGVAAVAVVIVGLILVVGLSGNDDVTDGDNVQFKQLEDNQQEAKLSQEAARELESVDTSGYSEEELYDYYLSFAELLMGSTDYESAIFAYQKAAEAKPGDPSILIAQAEAHIANGDAESARQTYQRALDVFIASGAPGAEQYTEYIEIQIENSDSAVEQGIGPIFDGRQNNEEDFNESGAEEDGQQ